MCFKRKPKYHWILTISTDNQLTAEQAYYFTKDQLNLINESYYATVKEMNKFCMYVIDHIFGIIKIEAETKHYLGEPRIKIEITKISESVDEIKNIS